MGSSDDRRLTSVEEMLLEFNEEFTAKGVEPDVQPYLDRCRTDEDRAEFLSLADTLLLSRSGLEKLARRGELAETLVDSEGDGRGVAM